MIISGQWNSLKIKTQESYERIVRRTQNANSLVHNKVDGLFHLARETTSEDGSMARSAATNALPSSTSISSTHRNYFFARNLIQESV